MNSNHKRLYPGLKNNTPGEKANHLYAIVRNAKELADEDIFGESAKGKLAEYLNKFIVSIEDFISVSTLIYYEHFITITNEIQRLVDEINSGEFSINFESVITEIEETHWERLAEIDKVIGGYIILRGNPIDIDELVSLYLQPMHKGDALFFYEFSSYGRGYFQEYGK